MKEAIPSTEPHWDPNTRIGKESLRHPTTCLLQGMTWGVQKVVNYKKIKTIYRERMKIQPFIWEDSQRPLITTQADLKSIEGKVPLAHSFTTQAVPDIKRKLQKLGKGPEILISDLVEEANRMFLNRDLEEEAKKEIKEA